MLTYHATPASSITGSWSYRAHQYAAFVVRTPCPHEAGRRRHLAIVAAVLKCVRSSWCCQPAALVLHEHFNLASNCAGASPIINSHSSEKSKDFFDVPEQKFWSVTLKPVSSRPMDVVSCLRLAVCPSDVSGRQHIKSFLPSPKKDNFWCNQ